MIQDEQFTGIRKGLLEFALLTLIGAKRVYVADILARLAPTPFATQEGTLYPLLSRKGPRAARRPGRLLAPSDHHS
jgi:PadR family transcriptional regulator PadR